jgi:hypothetical protein
VGLNKITSRVVHKVVYELFFPCQGESGGEEFSEEGVGIFSGGQVG